MSGKNLQAWRGIVAYVPVFNHRDYLAPKAPPVFAPRAGGSVLLALAGYT
jgi:hypothetical protein